MGISENQKLGWLNSKLRVFVIYETHIARKGYVTQWCMKSFITQLAEQQWNTHKQIYL